MFKRLFKYSLHRNFSQSRIGRNIEKVKPDEPSERTVKMDYKPNEFEKKILVWSGKFKSDNIPSRVSLGVIEDAKSRVRIRVSAVLMILTLFLCGYYIRKGKIKAGEGYNINKMYMEKYEKAMKEEQK